MWMILRWSRFVKSQVKGWFTVMTKVTLCSKRVVAKNAVEWTKKAKLRKAEFLAVSKANKIIFCTTPGLKQEPRIALELQQSWGVGVRGGTQFLRPQSPPMATKQVCAEAQSLANTLVLHGVQCMIVVLRCILCLLLSSTGGCQGLEHVKYS